RPGTPIVRLISAGSYVVRFAVPPAESGRLRVGEPLVFRAETLPAGVPGAITQISPQVDSASQMVFAEAGLALPAAAGAAGPAGLQDGLVGTVRVEPARKP
ncbi:MAG TPA: HlyD family efflux transporter periplasmic adaptor subunit, partial [Thermoanaerobaculia bacterium]|nr:HlyD family efflux transporter periplasmic adaptor subunit [Thermoanaerobaculia bacterium]